MTKLIKIAFICAASSILLLVLIAMLFPDIYLQVYKVPVVLTCIFSLLTLPHQTSLYSKFFTLVIVSFLLIAQFQIGSSGLAYFTFAFFVVHALFGVLLIKESKKQEENIIKQTLFALGFMLIFKIVFMFIGATVVEFYTDVVIFTLILIILPWSKQIKLDHALLAMIFALSGMLSFLF